MTQTLTYAKEHLLSKLHDDLVAAIPGLAPVTIPGDPNGLMTPMMAISGDGQTVVLDVPDDTNEAEVAAVVAAHDPTPPVVVVGQITVDDIVRTTDATPAEVFRTTTLPKHLYRGTFSLLAIDAGSGASKDTEARLSFKQQAGAAVQVGATVIISTIQDAAAASWAIQGSSDGADFLVSVRGASGRTIDWALVGQIAVYAPDGLG